MNTALSANDARKSPPDANDSDLAKALESRQASSLPDMINAALGLAALSASQGHPERAERSLAAALDAVHRAGGEDLLLMSFLVAAQAGGGKYADAEATLRKLAENPAASNQTQATIGISQRPLPFALRNLGAAYRRDGKFAQAELHLLKLVALDRELDGVSVQQTRVDISTLAENYANQQKYPQSEELLSELLKLQRQFNTPQGNVFLTVANLGWVRFQQKKYPEAETTLREAADGLRRLAPNAMERYYAECMLGIGLAAQKRFEQAEPLLISGYEGLGKSQRVFPAASVFGASTQAQAGEAIVKLYADWMKSDKQAEWVERIKAKK
jgi:tetratricopeptide (TPR) repeat protein